MLLKKKFSYIYSITLYSQGFYDDLSGWLIVFIVGITTGFVGGIIDIGSEWMTDLKEGTCKHQFWFNKQTCCWNAPVSKVGEGGCDYWVLWSDIFKLNTAPNSREPYIFNYFCYVFSAFIFSGIAVSLVRFFAPYASGSGIAEVFIILCLKVLS